MDDPADELFHRGVGLFNAGAFFDAHEVWEDLWRDCASAERRFFQALIQAAVSAYHRGRGNMAGATRLLNSGRKYMEPFRPHHRGLDVDAFWAAMAAHLAGGPAPTVVLLPSPANEPRRS
jgi:predicted metal-dependent hydrolase